MAREALVGALPGNLDKVKTSKKSFSDDVTKAINEGKPIDEIKQIAYTHGGTIESGLVENWKRVQQLMMGSFTHFSYQGHIATKTSAGEIWEISISVPNPVLGSGDKYNSMALGDGLVVAKIDEKGNITFSNMTMDVKAGVGAYGKDQAMFKYGTWNESKLKANEFDAKQAERDDINQQIGNLEAKEPNLTDLERTRLDQLNQQADVLKNEYEKMTKYAFDYQREKINNDPDLTEIVKQRELDKVDVAEQEFFRGLGDSMLSSGNLESLISTSGTLEFHGSLKHAIGPSLKELPEDILTNPEKLKKAVADAATHAKYLADYIAYMGMRGDLIGDIPLNAKNIELIKQGGTTWDPRTGNWLSDKIYIAIPKIVENVPIQIKMADPNTNTTKVERIDLQTRIDVDSFYGFEKKYDAEGNLTGIEVKEFKKEDVIRELDANSLDASLKQLNEAVEQMRLTAVQNQLVAQQAKVGQVITDTLESIADVLEQLEIQGAGIRAQLDTTLTLEQQAQQAIHLQHSLLDIAKHTFIDVHVQAAFAQMLPVKSLQQFSQDSIAKDLTGDALWQDVINAVSRYTSTSAFGCFAAGTLVHTEQGWTPIQDIKVGDLVLSKPENGEGEASYHPVLNTFVHENKELWLVVAERHWNNRDIHGKRINDKLHDRTTRASEFIATPNHPVWVVGVGIPDAEQRIRSFNIYPQPQWKRVDQLQQHEVMVNKDGIMFCIQRAQPLFYIDKSCSPRWEFDINSHVQIKPAMWYQDEYYYASPYKNREDFEDSEESKDYDTYQEYLANEALNLRQGRVKDIEDYYKLGYTRLSIENSKGGIGHLNLSKDENGQYIPFTDTVYNLEVADHHTYFVSDAGIFVHNTSSPEQILLQMATDLANQVTTISTTELEQLYPVAQQYWLDAGAQQSDLDKIRIQLGYLQDNALAITEGTRITVSPNAAGWGWFVDATPNLNEEFNLGSNYYNFDAKQGGEADNKIDLLTVLIHEIGNVLGVSHRLADDVMSLTIGEGQREYRKYKAPFHP